MGHLMAAYAAAPSEGPKLLAELQKEKGGGAGGTRRIGPRVSERIWRARATPALHPLTRFAV